MKFYLVVLALILGLTPTAFGSCDGTTVEHTVVDDDRTWNIAKNAYGSDTLTANMLGQVWDLSIIASGHIAHIAPGDIIVLPCTKISAPERTTPVKEIIVPSSFLEDWPTDSDSTFTWCPEDYVVLDIACLVKDEEVPAPLPAPKQVAQVEKKDIDDDPYSMRKTNESVAKYLELRRAAQNTPKLETVARMEVIPTAVQVPKPAQKKAELAKAPKPPKEHQYVVRIPQGIVPDIDAGNFPAIIADDLKKKKVDDVEVETWGKRKNADVWVKKTLTAVETPTGVEKGAVYYLFFKSAEKLKPSTILWVDFKGENRPFPFNREFLSDADHMEESKPSVKFRDKDYTRLHASISKKDNFLWAGTKFLGGSLRRYGPKYGITAVTAFAAPQTLIPVVINEVGSHVAAKKDASKIQQLTEQVAYQQAMLEAIMEALQPPAQELAQLQ